MTKSIALCVALPAILLAQPAFEVASIKPHPQTPGPVRVTRSAENGTINFVNMTLKACIRAAYGLRAYQISGGPDWLDSERYDIVAKAAGRATSQQMMPMLQTLLVDRFKLAVRRESKDLPTYDLVIAKNGPKIQAVKDDDGPSQIDGDEQHPIIARKISMTALAGILSSGPQSDRPVFDQTGLKGVFTFTLSLAKDDPSLDAPDIFTALQEQLGLKLVQSHRPIEIIVIEHAERPTAN